MQDGFEPPLPRPEDRDGMILRHPLAIAAATLLGLLASAGVVSGTVPRTCAESVPATNAISVWPAGTSLCAQTAIPEF